MKSPVFIFAAGWRSGSTLLQRLLCSHPAIHIWGENRGLCAHLEQMHETMTCIQSKSALAAREFHALQSHAWIAMLNPPLDGLLIGIRSLLDQYFDQPTRCLGKTRWGFKEVRHGLETAMFLRRIYPESKFLFVVRNPRDCLASARATGTSMPNAGLLVEVGGSAVFLEHWRQIAASFLEPLDPEMALRLRYEDIVADPEHTMREIAEFLNVAASGFRREVFDVRRRGWAEDEPQLDDADHRALAAEGLWEIATRYGYSLEGRSAIASSGSRRSV